MQLGVGQCECGDICYIINVDPTEASFLYISVDDAVPDGFLAAIAQQVLLEGLWPQVSEGEP